MNGMTSAVALREETAIDGHTGALAISADQVQWTTMQEAALNQLGLKNAPNGDRLVFLHVAQRTGLDPFAKQIHMIERGGKWGIQTGIDGFRVMRARAEREAGVRGILGQAVYVDADGSECKRWFKSTPPVGCEITYTVRELTAVGTIDTPYTSYLRFTEYAQYFSGKLGPKWASSPAHMLEKCTEADVYRKAFPQDFSGISLEDAQAGDGSDGAPAEQQQRRKRVTADTIRARQTVTATVVTEAPSPAAPDTPVSGPAAAQDPPAEVAAAGDGLTRDELLAGIGSHLKRLGVTASNAPAVISLVNGRPVTSTKEMGDEEVRKVHDTLESLTDGAALDLYRAEAVMDGDPRDQDGEPDE